MYVYAETILIRGAARGYRSGAISSRERRTDARRSHYGLLIRWMTQDIGVVGRRSLVVGEMCRPHRNP